MSPTKRRQTDPLEKAIEAALSPGRFISYNAAWPFVEDVQGVADDIDKIGRKEPERAARLYEIFIAACHEKADEIDDSSGDFGMLVEELFQGWIKARQCANFDPDETAISLISWMEDDPYGFCYDLERGAVKVLDKKGLAAFIQQIRAKFESVPTRDDEEKRFSGYERRRWGGVPGYVEFCNALKDPNHEEHESYMEWPGGDYYSERFDSESINWELMKYLRWSRDRYQNWGGFG